MSPKKQKNSLLSLNKVNYEQRIQKKKRRRLTWNSQELKELQTLHDSNRRRSQPYELLSF